MENSERVSASEPGPGELLRSAREALGISQREMADRLNWMPGYVAAIEENRFEVLRGAAFVRGYLRVYAKLVAVPEDTLMAAYAALPTGEAPTDEGRRRIESRVPQVQKKGIAIPAGAAIVALVVFLLWYWRGEDPQGAVAPAPAAIGYNKIDAPKQAEALVQEQSVAFLIAPESASSAPQPTVIEVPAEVNAVVAAGTPAATEVQAVGVESELVVDSQLMEIAPAASTRPPVTESVAAPDADASSSAELAASGLADAREGQLQFRFSGDCWLEVRNAAGELIYADLRRDGDVLNLSGEAPFKVLVGDVEVVELDYLGQAVAIKRRPGRLTANFSVGEL